MITAGRCHLQYQLFGVGGDTDLLLLTVLYIPCNQGQWPTSSGSSGMIQSRCSIYVSLPHSLFSTFIECPYILSMGTAVTNRTVESLLPRNTGSQLCHSLEAWMGQQKVTPECPDWNINGGGLSFLPPLWPLPYSPLISMVTGGKDGAQCSFHLPLLF